MYSVLLPRHFDDVRNRTPLSVEALFPLFEGVPEGRGSFETNREKVKLWKNIIFKATGNRQQATGPKVKVIVKVIVIVKVTVMLTAKSQQLIANSQ